MMSSWNILSDTSPTRQNEHFSVYVPEGISLYPLLKFGVLVWKRLLMNCLLTPAFSFCHTRRSFKICWKTHTVAFSILTDRMIVSIASQKGGTGKTTTSISLAAGLARKGEKILLIDIDSQANSSKVLIPHYQTLTKEQTIYTTILDRNPLPLHQTHIPTLQIVPSHILLSNTDVELTTAKDHREERLKRELDKIKQTYEFVFIDCPPALSWLTLNAFTASDKVIIVVSPGYFELDSIVQISKTITNVRQYFNPA